MISKGKIMMGKGKIIGKGKINIFGMAKLWVKFLGMARFSMVKGNILGITKFWIKAVFWI